MLPEYAVSYKHCTFALAQAYAVHLPPAWAHGLTLLRGLRNPQQRTGADGTPLDEVNQASPAAAAAELERKNSKLTRRASQKLQWKPLDMSASSDVAEILSPFNQAGSERP